MAEQLDYVAFEWVTTELDDTIKQARQALEAYSQDKNDFSKLRFTLTHAHQINGTLRMVQLSNLVTLAEEIEAVAQALVNSSTPDEDSALEILMTSLLQLPGLLERVKKVKSDISPAALQPIINELKSVRGAEPTLAPKAADFSAAFSSRVSREDFDDLAAKLRKMFRVAVLNIARNNDIDKNIRYLAQIGQRIHKISQNTAQEFFWRTALGLFETLEEGSLAVNNEVGDLLLELDKLLINIAGGGPDSLKEPAPERIHGLMKALLQTARSEQPLVKDLQNQWAEELKTPSELEAMGPDSDTLQSVVDALLEELTSIKDYIDLFVRNRERDEVELEPALPVFKRVINTMMVLGLGDALRVIRRQAETIEQMVNGQLDPSNDALMDVAESILGVEAVLNETVTQEGMDAAAQTTERDRQLAAAFQSVVKEARAGIEQSKEAVIEFIAHQWDHERLRAVPSLLSEVRGGLMILPLERAANILASCEWYICDHLLSGKRVPEWQMLDTLADALTSVDYYLERIVQDTLIESDMILDVAVESVATLGFPITDLDKWERRPELYLLEDTHEDDNLEISEFMVLDDEFDQYAAARLKDDMDAAAQGKQQPEPAPKAEQLTPPVTEASVAQAADSAAQQSEEDEVDDEIIEIFKEEVEEVVAELDQFIPDMANDRSLNEVRRGFHTIKGSGRMVGANDAGELAWSVENMLNRVVDGSQTLTPAHGELVRQARALMPKLIEDFATGQSTAAAESARLSELADAISTGQSDIVTVEQISAGITHVDEQAQDLEQEDPQFAEEMLRSVSHLVDEPPANAADLAEPEVPVASSAELVEKAEQAEETEQAETATQESDEDQALQQIFTAEANTHIAEIDAFVEEFNVHANDEVSEQLHRSLHTIKGSARIAGYEHISAYIGPLESYVLELHQLRRPISGEAVELLEHASKLVKADLETLPESDLQSQASADELIVELAGLKEALQHEDNAAEAEAADTEQDFSVYLNTTMDQVSQCEELLAEAKAGRSSGDALLRIAELQRTIATHSKTNEQADIAALALASAEAYEQAATLDWLPERFFDMANKGQEGLNVAIDNLASGQSIAEAAEFQAARQAIAEFDLASYQRELNEREQAVDVAEAEADARIESSSKNTELLISQWMKDKFEPNTPQEMAQQFFNEESSKEQHDSDKQLNASSSSVFLAATGLLGSKKPSMPAEAGNEAIADRSGEDNTEGAETAVPDTDMVALDAGTNLDGVETEAQAAVIEADAEAVVDSDAVPPQPAEDPETALQAFGDMELASQPAEIDSEALSFDEELLNEELEEEPLDAGPLDDAPADDAVAEQQAQPDEAASIATVVERLSIVSEPEPAQPESESEAEQVVQRLAEESADNVDTDTGAAADDEVDPEILEIFCEEAADLLEDIDETVHAWQDEPAASQHVDGLQRALHTLKGGARLADVTALGDLAHDCETYVEKAEQAGGNYDQNFFRELQSYLDRITHEVDVLRDPSLAVDTHEDEDESADQVLEGQFEVDDVETVEPQPVAEAAQDDTVVQLTPAPAPAKPDTAPAVADAADAPAAVEASRRTAQEVVRVPSQLLENLVNLAGETSISRARAEEQVSEFGFSLEEMEGTVERLQDKLRRLEMETEAQILFRQEQVEQEGLDSFDPLEMDRYSQLQTLSRSLMESASDLLDLKNTMSEKARDMETLLLQQSRINTDLQEGLMQSRMVPFSRLVPRLRRIVRQVSNELGKQVEFELLNIEGEMDRSVLERMLPPLEHMLRNAVDHGIETAEVRRDYDKPAVGNISLGLMREGNEVVIVLEDDGAGIDVSRVRDKAIEAGLMSADADLGEHEILQFILETGVSTATELTQISGRGVGLDVVNSEIKQLGGTMDIQSRRGLGTKFVVRLPFTVSVNRALTVSVGSDMYAIPLNSIEGIVRVSPFELEAYYQPDSPRFEYAGQPYDLRYLGTMLGLEANPQIRSYSAPLPVVLVRAGDNAVAIQVDGVHGSREVVVKSLGPQFGMVHGVSGATVLGDGRVVVILDLLAIIRQQASMALKGQVQPAFPIEHVEEEEPEDSNVVVMVVDDSVTVRKVTSRFLERQGMDVIVARDGVDAMALLQDNTPDVMLLDIEMPRMDGFEVANQVRHHSRLKDLPIIMITSRTGDKHRERAFSIGVNNYLGKPYQEMELLDAITDLVGVKRLQKTN